MASRASGSGSWRFRREKTDPPASSGPGATPQIIVTSPHQGPDGQLMRHPLPRAARAPPAARKPKDPAAGAPDDAFLNRHATEDAESVHADDDDRLRRNRDVSAGGATLGDHRAKRAAEIERPVLKKKAEVLSSAILSYLYLSLSILIYQQPSSSMHSHLRSDLVSSK